MGAKLCLFRMKEEQAESVRKQGARKIPGPKRKEVAGEWRKLHCTTRSI
jgi:hypothetical protein